MLKSQFQLTHVSAINAHPARKSEAMLVDNNSNRLGDGLLNSCDTWEFIGHFNSEMITSGKIPM